ncbi:WYL domain-containing protein [Shewanella algae]|uniref:helix-turn-helix transcriptional regulator n=1 Tax=Shewanella algae TaxID=38313 RepID=UPI00313E76F1
MDEGIEVTLRTVQRDMESICQRFPIYSTTQSKPLRWIWVDKRKIDIQGVSINEALSLMLVGNTMRQLLPSSVLKSLQPSIESAQQILQAMKSQSDVASWFEKVGSVQAGMEQLPPSIDDDILCDVQHALLKDDTVELTYLGAHQSVTKVYQLLPLALVQRGRTLYLVAQLINETTTKLFAMHRVKGVKNLGRLMCRPQNFVLQDYLNNGAMQFSQGKKISLRARILSELAFHLAETPLSDDMQITSTDNDYFQLQATVQDSWQLQWWLLSYADQLEVISPVALRQTIKQKLQAALAQYQ